MLHTLRAGKFTLDVVITGTIVYATWPPGWYLLLIPVAVSATHQGAELAVRGVVEGARSRIRHQPRGFGFRRAHDSPGNMALRMARDRRFQHREIAAGVAPRSRNDPPDGAARAGQGRRDDGEAHHRNPEPPPQKLRRRDPPSRDRKGVGEQSAPCGRARKALKATA
ncbi:MAG: hypothetical protein U0792_02550 [Gemmataceae bacterium]